MENNPSNPSPGFQEGGVPNAPSPQPTLTATDARAYLLSMAYGEDTMTPAQALAFMQHRIDCLRDPSSPEALAELAAQLPVIEALWQRFAAEAMRNRRPEAASRLLRAALHAQQAYARTFTLLRALHAPGVGVSVDLGASD